jgi:hypothetical protein
MIGLSPHRLPTCGLCTEAHAAPRHLRLRRICLSLYAWPSAIRVQRRPEAPEAGSDRAAELVRSAFGSDRDGDGLSFFQSIGRQSLGDILSRDAVPHIIAANPFFPIV